MKRLVEIDLSEMFSWLVSKMSKETNSLASTSCARKQSSIRLIGFILEVNLKLILFSELYHKSLHTLYKELLDLF